MKLSFGAWKGIRDAYANRHEPESYRILAEAYWHSLLYVTIMVVLVAASYSALQLISVFKTPQVESMIVSVDARPPILDRTQLEATIDGLKERKVRYEDVRTNAQQFADPSR